MKADPVATRKRKFKDPKSFVTWDGRDILVGEDWIARRFELLKRCGGRCEYVMEITTKAANLPKLERLRCQREAADPHHIELRSVRRSDNLEDLKALCRHHHNIVDAQQRLDKRRRKATFQIIEEEKAS